MRLSGVAASLPQAISLVGQPKILKLLLFFFNDCAWQSCKTSHGPPQGARGPQSLPLGDNPNWKCTAWYRPGSAALFTVTACKVASNHGFHELKGSMVVLACQGVYYLHYQMNMDALGSGVTRPALHVPSSS